MFLGNLKLQFILDTENSYSDEIDNFLEIGDGNQDQTINYVVLFMSTFEIIDNIL